MSEFTEGSIALITGAAGDIGRAVAVRLAADGVTIGLADLPAVRGALEETQAHCRRAAGSESRIAIVTFDVTDPDQAGYALEELADGVGAPNLLFNNAGIQGEFANSLDASLADVRRVLDVNVYGAFTVLQAFAARLRTSGQPGAVVNTASMAGVAGAPNMAAYSASKAAVIGLTKSAAKDLAPFGIRVNAISPAFIGPGAMWDNQVRRQADLASIYYADDPEEVARQMIAQVPLRRYGSLDEVAAAARFLLSDDASYLTGVNLEIAGGAS